MTAYTVLATPSWGGTISFKALLQPDVVGPAVATGSSASLALSAGQVERLTFNANAGDSIELELLGLATIPAGQSVTVQVYSPTVGQAITSSTTAYASLTTASAQALNLANLPLSGTYTVIVTPTYGLPANAQLDVTAEVVVPSTGTFQSLAANGSGENVYMTFSATQNQNLELTLNNVSVVGGSQNQFSVVVYLSLIHI